jgi:hypothetical protein
MTDLKELLDGVAGQAKLYDGMERAITVARRRRRALRLAPVAAAVVLAVALVAVWVPLHRQPGGSDVAAPGELTWLPGRVGVPEQPLPPLPADRAVAPGVLTYMAYDPPNFGGATLLTEDGRQYRLAGRGEEPFSATGISPDGRWLLTVRGGKAVLRDLSGAAERQIATGDGMGMSWSPDGRWLAVWTNTWSPDERAPSPENATSSVSVIDLHAPQEPPVRLTRLPAQSRMIGVLDSGELVLTPIDLHRTLDVWMIDPKTGERRRHYTLDATPWLPQQKYLPFTEQALTPDGRTLLVRSFLKVVGDYPDSDDLLAVDLETGRVTRRYPLPDPHPLPYTVKGPPEAVDLSDNRALVAVLPDGVLLQHIGRPETGGGPFVIELLDLSTGKLHPASDLSAGVYRIHAVRGG